MKYRVIIHPSKNEERPLKENEFIIGNKKYWVFANEKDSKLKGVDGACYEKLVGLGKKLIEGGLEGEIKFTVEFDTF